MKSDPNVFAGIMATDVRAVEHALDEAIAAAGQMLQNFAQGRRSANLGVRVGQPALVKMMGALSAVVEARGGVASAHDLMAATARRHGLSYADAGPFEDKGDPDEKEDPRVLTLVGR
ncbi:hypothetical protein JIP62_01915 [Brevundimonas vitis]|uniref:Uncharacterized protein n=1 Tax=Brevundimonas vitisensis TaxID=2800818 RepID=A0ABX7BNU5_9CAUL|nr:hypothetical protein [Brevundimonas vitisensis]QQQ18917.1 hypothetical protein JIP62_01915 [Brevundimonas vitisensis]